MNKTTIALSILAAGCATHTAPQQAGESIPTVPATAPDEAQPSGPLTYGDWSTNSEAVADSLARLNALEIINATDLIVDAPQGAMNCYGPCADDPADQAWMQEHARQTARLQALTEAAESAANANPAEVDVVDDALQSLRDLQIVEITGLTNAGHCYGPCPEDAGAVQALAEAASDL